MSLYGGGIISLFLIKLAVARLSNVHFYCTKSCYLATASKDK